MKQIRLLSIGLTLGCLLAGVCHADGFRRGSGFNEGDLEMEDYSIIFAEKSADPPTPITDEIALYAKNNGSTTKLYTKDDAGTVVELGAGSSAPTDATYITNTANATLSAEQALSTLSTGVTTVTTGTGTLNSYATTAYAPIFGSTTGTIQSGTLGNAGQVLTSNGAGAFPTFQNATGGSGGVTVGDAVSGGTAHNVLFTDASGNVGQDADFTFTAATNTFAATSMTGTTGTFTGANALRLGTSGSDVNVQNVDDYTATSNGLRTWDESENNFTFYGYGLNDAENAVRSVINLKATGSGRAGRMWFMGADNNTNGIEIVASSDGGLNYIVGVGSSAGGLFFHQSNSAVWPMQGPTAFGGSGTLGDGIVALGHPSFRFSNIHMSGDLNVGTDLGGKLNIDGSANEIQLLVQGNGTQTNPIMTVETSAGTDVFTVTTSAVGVSSTSPHSPLTVQGSGAFAVTTMTGTSNTLTSAHSNVLINNSDPFVLDLPTAAGIPGRQYTIKKVSSDTADTVTIDPFSTQEIDGQTSIILYVENDFITIVSDGTNWRVVADGVQPHVAKIQRSTAQTILNNTVTTIQFDTTLKDNAGLSDLANYRVVIRRGGTYRLTGHMVSEAVMDDAESFISTIQVNGSDVVQTNTLSPAASAVMSVNPTTEIDLSSGDVVTFTVFHLEGSSINTRTDGVNRTPVLEVSEIRGGGHGSGGVIPLSEVWVSVGNGHGSTNNKIRRFTTQRANTGTAITYADSAANGASFTINENGLYALNFTDRYSAGTTVIGVTVNSSSLTTAVTSINQPEALGFSIVPATMTACFSITKRFSAGDVIRPHTDGNPDGTGASNQFQIIKIGN